MDVDEPKVPLSSIPVGEAFAFASGDLGVRITRHASLPQPPAGEVAFVSLPSWEDRNMGGTVLVYPLAYKLARV